MLLKFAFHKQIHGDNSLQMEDKRNDSNYIILEEEEYSRYLGWN